MKKNKSRSKQKAGSDKGTELERQEANTLFIKIGSVDFARSAQAQYTVQTYSESSIAIRGHIQSESDLALTEKQLYLLREGRTEEIEIQTDDGRVWKGLYRINELSWRKERRSDNSYELLFNIGLRKQ